MPGIRTSKPAPGVPTSRTIAGLDLTQDRSAAELKTALASELNATYARHGEYAAPYAAARDGEVLSEVETTYFPTAGGSATRTGATTWADVDATNLKLSIVVPPSGVIKGTLSAFASVTGGAFHYWGVADDLGDIAESQAIITVLGSQVRHKHEFTITKDGAGTALVPGKVLNLRWRFAVGNSAQTATISYGGRGTATPTGSAIMRARQATNRLTAKNVTAALSTSPNWVPYDIAADGKKMVGRVGIGQPAITGRLAHSNDAGVTWAELPNLASPQGFQQAWFAGDGEILVTAGVSGSAPGRIFKSSGWATNPLTATFTEVLRANNENNDNAVYFANYAGYHQHGNICVVNEYGPKGAVSMARYAYVTEDHGATWRKILDLKTLMQATSPGWDGTDAHVHASVYDPWWDCIWVVTGDYDGAGGTKPYTLVSFDWRSANPTWNIAYSKHQYTSITPMPGCILFGTDMGSSAQDGKGNGLHRLRRSHPADFTVGGEKVVEDAYVLDTVSGISVIGGVYRRHRHIPDAPTIIGLGESGASGPTSRLVVTYDGFTFREVYTSDDIGTLGEVASIVGPIGNTVQANVRRTGEPSARSMVTLTFG